MNKEHTRPFSLSDAKAGAPYSTRDGRKAEVLKWDGKGSGEFALIGWLQSGGEQVPASWKINGRFHISACDNDLVMTPLAYVENKPVFVGDELEVLSSVSVGDYWKKIKVSQTIFPRPDAWLSQLVMYRWPIPEPASKMITESESESEELKRLLNNSILLDRKALAYIEQLEGVLDQLTNAIKTEERLK